MKNQKVWAFSKSLISTYERKIEPESIRRIQRIERYQLDIPLEPEREVTIYRLLAEDESKQN